MSTTIVPVEPCSGFHKEIGSQSSGVDEVVSLFVVTDMLVISLSCFVVVAQYADAIDDERETVFEPVTASPHRIRHAPENEFDEDAFAQPVAFADQ
jgi:hypothetical protein